MNQAVHAYWLQIRRKDEWRNIEPREFIEADGTTNAGGNEVFDLLSQLLQQGNFDELRLTRGTREPNGEVHYSLMASFAPGKILSLDPMIRDMIFNIQGASQPPPSPSVQPAAPPVSQPPPETHTAQTHALTESHDSHHFASNHFDIGAPDTGAPDTDAPEPNYQDHDYNDNDYHHEWDTHHEPAHDSRGTDMFGDPKPSRASIWGRMGLFVGFVLVLLVGLFVLVWQIKDDLPFMGQIESMITGFQTQENDSEGTPMSDHNNANGTDHKANDHQAIAALPAANDQAGSLEPPLESSLQPLNQAAIDAMQPVPTLPELPTQSVDEMVAIAPLEPRDAPQPDSLMINSAVTPAPLLPATITPAPITSAPIASAPIASAPSMDSNIMDSNIEVMGGDNPPFPPPLLPPEARNPLPLASEIMVKTPLNPQDEPPEDMREARPISPAPESQPDSQLANLTPPPLPGGSLNLSEYRTLMNAFTWEDTVTLAQPRIEYCKELDQQFTVCKLMENSWFTDSSAIVAQFDKFNGNRLISLQVYGMAVEGATALKDQFEMIVKQIRGKLPAEQAGFDTRRETTGTEFFNNLRSEDTKNAFFSYWPDNNGQFPVFVYAKISPLSANSGYYHILIGKPKPR